MQYSCENHRNYLNVTALDYNHGTTEAVSRLHSENKSLEDLLGYYYQKTRRRKDGRGHGARAKIGKMNQNDLVRFLTLNRVPTEAVPPRPL